MNSLIQRGLRLITGWKHAIGTGQKYIDIDAFVKQGTLWKAIAIVRICDRILLPRPPFWDKIFKK